VTKGAPQPRFSIKQVRRNLDIIWNDDSKGKNIVKKSTILKAKPPKSKIKECVIESAYGLNTPSNCRAVRLQPGRYCRNLVVKDNRVFGTDIEMKDNEG